MAIRQTTTLAVLALVACNSASHGQRVDAVGAVAADTTLNVDAGVADVSTGADNVVGEVSERALTEVSAPASVSPGCSQERSHMPGGVQVNYTFSELAGGKRSFYLSVPASYDPAVPQRLIFGYAGTNWTGQKIAPYLGLETTAPQAGEIYVYPDLQWHDFKGWGNIGGWLLGPHATPAHGMADIEFTRELVALLSEQYCIDPHRVFATGHSWGGDMAAVVGCFLGNLFAAVAPAAANRPYWFEPNDGPVGCVGSTAVWTFFGQNDAHFSGQKKPGQFGDEQVAFWKAHHQCGNSETVLKDGDGECVQYEGCTSDTRYCFYSAEAGHQIPDYFSATVLAWFRDFQAPGQPN